MFDLEEEFDKSWQEESRKHAAITIRNEVGDWCQSSKRPLAEKRWLWELFQNAIDTAKSHSVQELNISLELKDGNLLVRHNGGSFQLKEIIALVSGGTSKYFGRETIGRFGKGFLVTHILSRKVVVKGLITHAEETRLFRIGLDRSGDENAIEKNINDCKKQLSQTSKDTAALAQNETTFTYIGADEKALELCRNLEHILPYVMTFNPMLKRVYINLGKENFQGEWRAKESSQCVFGGHIIDQQTIASSSGNVTCLKTSDDGLEVAIQSTDLDGQVQVVDTKLTPCFYSTLPLCDSDAIIASYAINSKDFNIDTDRSFMNSTPENSELLGMLPDLLMVLLDDLAGIGAHGLHRLAYLDISKLPEDRKGFLREIFMSILKKISFKQIVECKSRSVTPSSAHIPTGDYLGQRVPNLVSHTNWLVAQQFPDVPGLFEEWEQIAKEWAALDVSLQTHSLESLIENSTVASQEFDLNTKKTYTISLVKALVLAQQATNSIPKGITEKRILLNQKLELVAPQDANIDSSVDEKLKSIASAAGWDIKNQLLDADQLQDDAMKAFIDHTLCSGREVFTSDLVLKRIWETYISTKWEENQKDPLYKKALLDLAIWLILNKKDEIQTILNPDSLPVLCDDGEFRCSEKTQSYPFIWPREKWTDSFKQYGSLINSRWIISGEYLRMLAEDQQQKFLEGLAALPVAFQEPAFTWNEKQLNEKEAETLACSGEFPNGAKVNSCYDLIGLQDMTSAIAGTKDLGKASKILEFILNYIINSDDSWESPVKLGEKTLFPCYWLAVLKTKDWVPSADGRHLEPLNRENLERLLLGIPNFQLTKRIVDFLAKHFNINLSGVLALKLKTMNPSDSRISLVDKLVALPTDYADKIADEVEDRLAIIQRVRRNQKIGKIVEEIVKQIFEREGFKTEWTGIGSDFKLIDSDDIGSILVKQRTGKTAGQEILIEVKAASTEMVRMTIEQSRRAVQQKAHFILCVADVSTVNFQSDNDEVMNDTLIETISHSLRFVSNISQRIEAAVEEAEELHHHQAELKDIEISPGVKIGFEESQIRIGVMKEIWEKGSALEEIVHYCESTFGDTV